MNVLWIVVDCLRSDACSANGYDRPTTTVIDDRLREEFITFTDACTQSGFTLNVAASMITGTYPSTHGVMNWSDEFQDDIPTYGDISEEMKIAPAEVISGMNFHQRMGTRSGVQ
jgi:arylsulfatase A-like enzyme